MPNKILSSSCQILLTLSCCVFVASAKYCERENDCDISIGEVCWWEWEGCARGECMCDPRNTYFDGSKKRCVPQKYGDERCEEGDRCWEGMSCIDGYCQCNQGTMSSDKSFCLRAHEKLLGDYCTSSDICYQKAVQEYTRRDVHCTSGGRCRCNHGFKATGKSCVRLLINEEGCRRDHHCQGGALCVDGVCKCPGRYTAVARNTKCARAGAFYFNIKLGETCDEYGEQAYCAQGLECRECPKDNFYTCARYVLPYHMSTATRNGNIFTLILPSLISLILAYLSCH